MIYLVYGGQYPVISKRCRKLVHSILGDEVDDFSYVKINAKEVLVQDIVYECSLLPLGGKKIVQVDNPYFLAPLKEKIDIEKDQDYNALEKYIENDDSEDVILLFFIEAEKLNEKNDITKAILSKGKVFFEEGLKAEDLKSTAPLYFQKKGASITSEALDLLLERIGDNVGSFIQEAEKLALYKKEIDVNDVAVMVPIPLEQNALNICEKLINGKTGIALKTFRDLLTQKEEPVRILNLLASQFRFYTEVSYLYSIEKLAQEDIASNLKVHPYRVKLACRNLVRIKYSELLNVMDYLYKMDCKIKEMENDPVNALELFIINFQDIAIGK